MDPAALSVDVDLPRRDFRLSASLRVGEAAVAVIGPSGAGKSTLLRAIAGFERPAAGRIALDDTVLFDSERRVDVAAERRPVGFVFQDYALFPHLTVRGNVAFGGRARADEMLERLGIAHLAGVRPGELSGGERQRVALARALARGPRALLLDEPMAALDPQTRDGIRAELRTLLRELRLPVLIVTHDAGDAAALAGRVAVLRAGRIVQEGTPDALLARPADAFVASFTGSNLLAGVATGERDGLTTVALETGGAVRSTDRIGGRVGVVVHPSDVIVARAAASDSALNHVSGPITSVVRVANRARVRVGPLTAEITTASVDRLALREGEPAVASFKATATRLVPLGEGALTPPEARTGSP